MFPLSVMVVATGVAFVVLWPRRIPQAARSTWRVLVEFKRAMDDANREVDGILKSAWREFRELPPQQRSPLVDTVVVIIGLSAVLVGYLIPAVQEFCRGILLQGFL